MQTHLLKEQTFELIAAITYAQSIRGINDPDQCIGLFKVVSPVRPDGLLSSNIPDVKLVSARR